MSGVDAKGVSRRIKEPGRRRKAAPIKESILAKIKRMIRFISACLRTFFRGFTLHVLALSNVFQEFYAARRPTVSCKFVMIRPARAEARAVRESHSFKEANTD